MTAYILEDFLKQYWYNNNHQCGTPDIFTTVSSENADPIGHYSMEQVERMLDGDDFEGITIGGFPIDGFYNYVTGKGDLIILNRDSEGFKHYTIKCD